MVGADVVRRRRRNHRLVHRRLPDTWHAGTPA